MTDEDYLNIVAHMLAVNGVDSVSEAITYASDFEITDNISRIVALRRPPEPPAPQGVTVAGNTEDFTPFTPANGGNAARPRPGRLAHAPARFLRPQLQPAR